MLGFPLSLSLAPSPFVALSLSFTHFLLCSLRVLPTSFYYVFLWAFLLLYILIIHNTVGCGYNETVFYDLHEESKRNLQIEKLPRRMQINSFSLGLPALSALPSLSLSVSSFWREGKWSFLISYRETRLYTLSLAVLLIASRRYCDSTHLYRLLLSLSFSLAILTKSRRGKGGGGTVGRGRAGHQVSVSFSSAAADDDDVTLELSDWEWRRLSLGAVSVHLLLLLLLSLVVVVAVDAVSYCGQSSVCACIECGLLRRLRCQIVIIDPDTSSQIGRTICVHWEKSSEWVSTDLSCNYIIDYF